MADESRAVTERIYSQSPDAVRMRGNRWRFAFTGKCSRCGRRKTTKGRVCERCLADTCEWKRTRRSKR